MGTAPTAEMLLEHAGFVRAMARGVLGDDDRVDDVVQDAFVAALTRERPPSRLRSWLASVGRRRAWDVRRKDAVRSRHETAVVRPATSPPAAELVERAELTRRLVVEMLALDAPYRDVLLLRYWEGLPPREIAARLDAPVETVRTRIRRAHEQLRTRLDAGHGGDRRAWAATLAAWAGAVGGARAAAGVAATAIGASALAANAAARTADPASPDEVPANSSAAGHGISGKSLLAIAGGVVAITAVVVLSRPWDGNDQPAVADTPRAAEAAGNQPRQSAGTSSRGVLAAKPAGPAPEPVATRKAEDADAMLGPPNCPCGPGQPKPEGPLSVHGTVKDASGAPVAWFPVRYSSKPSDKSIRSPGPSESYTDEEGRYTIDGVFPGALWMKLFTEVGFGPSSERTIDPAAAPTQDFVVAGAIVLAGEVKTTAAAPIEVWLEERREFPGYGQWDPWAARRQSLPAGTRTFRFTALGPGTYRLHAETGHARGEEMLSLYADRTDFAITPRALAPWRGRVVASPPLDVQRSEVWVLPPDSESWKRCDVAQDGTFVADEMPEGHCLLRARNTTEAADDSGRRHFGERTIEISVPPKDAVEIAIEPFEEVGLWVRTPAGAAVDGAVRGVGDAASARRAQGFRAESRDGSVTMTLPRSGRMLDGSLRSDGALLVPGVSRGRSTLRVTAVGFATVEREVVVAGPTTVDITLERRRGRVVRAEHPGDYWSVEARRVATATAAAEPWTRILWHDNRSPMIDRAIPGEHAAFLEAGEYDVRVVSDRHTPASIWPVRVDDGSEPLMLRFPTESGATIRGTLKTKAGIGATLLLRVFRREEDGSYWRLDEKEARTEDGPFTIRGLARGHYRLSPSADGEPVVAEVDVETGDTIVDATLPR